jgi:hypothetical protein
MIRIFPFLFLIFFSAELLSQTPMIITRVTGTINFDGIPDEEAWQSVQALPMTMFIPKAGGEPTENSDVKISYDNDYLYLAVMFSCKNPDDLRAIGKKRDYAQGSTDWLGLIIDSFNDKKNGVSFWTNPNGLRTDAALKNDVADSDLDVNFSWNTFWDAKTNISKEGWSAEFRIPFSSLRFQVRDGKCIMGIKVIRLIASKYEFESFPAISPDFVNAMWMPSLTREVLFEGIKPVKPVYIAPYVTAGIGQANELNDAETAYKLKTTLKYDAGLDVKFSLTNNMTADLTVNTDFAQVEADNEKINLTRYSLYFPEKRTFFQEKSDVFDFSFHDNNNLFYSRRIGLYDGHPVRIFGGARLTGRIDKWDVGFLDLQTGKYGENPSENFGVLRTKRTVINQNSYVGAMLTSRAGINGYYNVNYGIDGQFRIVGDDYLTLRWAQTIERDSSFRIFDPLSAKIMALWEHRNQKGFGYDFLVTRSGSGYNPGCGFEQMEHYQEVKGKLQYGWFNDEKSPIRYQSVSLAAMNWWNTLTGKQETASSILMWQFEAKKGYYGYTELTWSREDLTDSLSLGNKQAWIRPGRYSFTNLTVYYGTSVSHVFSSTYTAVAGSFYDGWRISFATTPSVNIGSDFSLSLTYNLDYVTFPSRSVNFTNHIFGMKGVMTLTTKTSLSAFVQYNTGADKLLANLRFRYNPREGNDFYIVYNEGLNTNVSRETPTLPLSSGRTLLLKYTYTFRF